MIKPIIEIKNLSAGYDGHTVLHDVNLSIYETGFSRYYRSERRRQNNAYKVHPRSVKTNRRGNYIPYSREGSHKNIYGRDFDRNICQKLPPKFFRKIPAFPRLPAAIQHHRPEVPYFRGRSDPVRIEHTKVAHLPVHSRTERERQTDYRPHGA